MPTKRKVAGSEDDQQGQAKQQDQKRPTDTGTLLKVARWFYKDELSKLKIAAHLGVDARKERAYLKEARDAGLIRIDIYEPPNAVSEHMESELSQKYPHLKKVKIVPARKSEIESDYPALLRRWAFEAQAYFETLVDEGKELHVGITGGETYLEFANAVPDRIRKDVYIYATTLIGRGRLTMSASHVDALVNATILWGKCGREPGHIHYATVPPYDAATMRFGIGKEIEAMARRKSIESVVRNMDEINVAFVGIGVVNPPAAGHRHTNRLTMLSLLKPLGVTSDDLAKEGAIGEMSGCLFDARGNTKKDWRFFISAGHYHSKGGGIEFYKRMVADGKTVIVIGGVQKEAAIYAALEAKAFNCWFTDEHTARTILAMES